MIWYDHTSIRIVTFIYAQRPDALCLVSVAKTLICNTRPQEAFLGKK